MEKVTCYGCDKEFKYVEPDIYEVCDTIEGQYHVFNVVKCPNCQCENVV